MKAGRFREVVKIFSEISELPSDQADERLLALSVADPEVSREVRKLLEAEREGSGGLTPLLVADVLPDAQPPDGEVEGSLTGTRIAQYEVGERIGRGGMGEVYAGIDTVLRREVALKSIRHEQRMSETARRRFLREARMLSSLDHPNICRIHDYLRGEAKDLLVLELIQGRSLRQAVTEGLSSAEALSIAEQLADALAAAHAEGVVHRDLKLSNVMLTDDGTAKILDFGLARPVESQDVESNLGPVEDFAHSLPKSDRFDRSVQFRTAAGLVTGTPSGMSPEQVEGRPATAASDMYSLGLLAQELFTGESPYDPQLDLGGLLDAARHGATRPVTGIDRDLAGLIEALTAEEARDRPTAPAVVARLGWIRDKPKRRLRRIAAAALFVIFALGGLKYTLDQRQYTIDLRRERTVADQRRSQAEDLIGFMVGDLRTKLAPLGRLDILDDVGDRAETYFASVPSEELSEEELLQRSKMLNQIGGVRIDQGRMADAEPAFEESLRLARDLVERRSTDARYLARLGEAYFWLGYERWEQGDLEGSYSYYSDYLESSRRLVEIEPENATWQTELAYGYANVGAVERRRGDLGLAESSFRQSIEIISSLVEQDPGSDYLQGELATFMSWLASTLEEQGDLAGAQAQFEQERGLRQAVLERDPSNAEVKLKLAFCLGYLGVLSRDQGYMDEGLARLQAQFELVEELADSDPGNLEWQRHLAAAQSNLGWTLLVGGDVDGGAARLQEALGTVLRLTEVDALNSDWRRQRAAIGTSTAIAWFEQGRISEARREAELSLAAVKRSLSEAPDDREALLTFARNHSLIGRIDSSEGREVEAELMWRSALDLIEPAARDSNDRDLLAAQVTLLLQLHRLDEATSVAEKLWAQGYKGSRLLGFWQERMSAIDGERH